MISGKRVTDGTESFALTPSERAYLQTGETGGYRKSALDSRIREKTESLPSRIYRLQNDVASLDEGGFLSDELAQSAWKDLIKKATLPLESSTFSGTSDFQEGFLPSTPAMRVGPILGEIAYPLTRGDDNSLLDLTSHITLGFIEGIFTEQMIAREIDELGYKNIIEMVTDMISGITEDIEEKREPMSDFFSKTRDSLDTQEEFRNKGISHVEKVLADEEIHGIEHNTLRDRLEDRDLGDESADDSKSAPEEPTADGMANLSDLAYSFIYRTWDHIVADSVDTDAIPGSAGVERYKIDMANTKPEEFAPRERVLDVIEQKRVFGRVILDKSIKRDMKKLDGQRWRGVSAETVFQSIHAREPIRSDSIANEISANKSLVTHLANLLSGEEFEVHESWNQLPLVTGDRAGWKLTEYGEALAEYKYGDNMWTVDALPDSIVDAGIDSLVDAGVVEPRFGIKS